MSFFSCPQKRKGELSVMTIDIKKRKNETVIRVIGVLDAITAPALEKTINNSAKNSSSIILDLNSVDEISGEGLQIILGVKKNMEREGSLQFTGVCESVMQLIER